MSTRNFYNAMTPGSSLSEEMMFGKTAYKQRVRAVLRSKKAQEVARAKFRNFKKVCQEVVRKKGAASRS